MKRFLLALAVVAGSAWAADFTGYISDSNCAKNAAKAASADHAKCAEACIKKGAKAVLVTEDGKVYNLKEQDKVVAHAGHKVTISGKLSGDTISVEEVKM